MQLCRASQAMRQRDDCGCTPVTGLLCVTFRQEIPQCRSGIVFHISTHNVKSYQKCWVMRLCLQLLGLALHSSANDGEAQLSSYPQQFPEQHVMLQRRRKAPSPSSSTASTRSDVLTVSLAVGVVAMMGRSLRHL